MATRAKLIGSARKLLETTPYRELSLASIAREAGTSPATFYQYFEDLGAVAMVLADEMLEQGHELVGPMRDASWATDDSSRSATEFVEAFCGFWEQHRTIIRLVEILSEEGDQRFQRVRKRIVFDVAEALADVIRKNSTEPAPPFDPMAAAGGLVSMMAHVATYRAELPYWGIEAEAVRHYIAQVLHWSVTRQPLTEPAPASAPSSPRKKRPAKRP